MNQATVVKTLSGFAVIELVDGKDRALAIVPGRTPDPREDMEAKAQAKWIAQIHALKDIATYFVEENKCTCGGKGHAPCLWCQFEEVVKNATSQD